VIANRLVIAGRITAMDALRHSPAGIPMLGATLAHQSRQVEAGNAREVRCEIPVIAFAEMAVALSEVGLNDAVEITGFIAQTRPTGPMITLHATQITLKQKESDYA
jgi:primosomal replication protein N